MEIIDVAFKVIRDILSRKFNFLDSLKQNCKYLDKYEKSYVSSLVGIYFRNYFLINEFLKEFNIKNDSDIGLLIGITFSNNSFKHVLKDELLKDELIKEVKNNKFLNEELFFNSFDKLISLRRKYEFKNIDKGSLEYVSIHLNLPIWLIKMIKRQYGNKDGISILKNLSIMPKQYLSLNFEKEIDKNDDLSSFTILNKDLFLYNENKTCKKEKLIFENILYLTQKHINECFDKILLFPSSKITYFSSSNDLIAIDFIKKFYNDYHEFNFVSSSLKSNYLLFDKIKSFNKSNFHFYELSSFGIKTYSSENEDLIMYVPNNSNIELFRKNPEYGVYFDSSILDIIVETIKKEIIELFNNLKKEGYLIYYVPTINKKETIYIKEFLMNNIDNSEIEIVDEKIYLPINDEDSLFYYFIVRRK